LVIIGIIKYNLYLKGVSYGRDKFCIGISHRDGHRNGHGKRDEK